MCTNEYTIMSDYDNHPLTYLVQWNDLAGVRYKVREIGVDVNSKDGKSCVPIHSAVRASDQDILKLLIEAGADVNIRDSWNGQTPIFMAKDVKIARILVNAGAETNVKDYSNFKPLQILVREKEKLPVIEYLVNWCGADVNAKNRIGEDTPLEIACNYNLCRNDGVPGKLSLEVIKFLMKNKADVNNIGGSRTTPLIQLLMYEKSLDPEFIKIFRLVLRYSDISVNYFGRRFNHLFVFNQKLCEILLEHVAVLLSLGTTLKSHEDLIENYSQMDLKAYFERCKNELIQAKKTKIGDSWVTFYNLLTDNKRKLKNYAGNDDLVEFFKGTDWTNEFPIYGKEMIEKMEKGVKIRKIYDESCGLLSHHVPIFDPYHLIVRDILDCLGCSTKDLVKFSSK